MKDKTPFGAYEQKNGKTCFGRVISVNPKTRTCRVKTLGLGSGPGGTNDLDQQEVQFLSLANHIDGDEDTYIPRPGQYGAVIFINAEPFLFGYYQPTLDTGSEDLPNKVPLEVGDRIIKMIAGNRVILRAGGSVEIESTKLCRTYWLPNQNVINSVCQNFELEADGGSFFWNRDDSNGNTLLELFAFDNVTPVNAIDLQLGTVDDNKSLLSLSLGPVDANNNIAAPIVDLRIAPNGDTDLKIGTTKMTLSIKGDTGDITMTTEGKVTQNIKGDVTQTVEGNVDETVKGNSQQSVDGNVSVSSKMNATVTAVGNASLTAEGNVTIGAAGGLSLTSDGNSQSQSKGSMQIKAQENAELGGAGLTNLGNGGSPTTVNGSIVALGGSGGLPVARVGDQAVGVGNLGVPVISTIISGSAKVIAS
jgi:hypothetical protein